MGQHLQVAEYALYLEEASTKSHRFVHKILKPAMSNELNGHQQTGPQALPRFFLFQGREQRHLQYIERSKEQSFIQIQCCQYRNLLAHY